MTNATQTSYPPHQHLCFIIHANVPYAYDFNAILALPAGFRYRNRFDERWVDPNLREDVEAATSVEVLLILRDQDANQLVPARWARIQLAQRIGRIYYFEYLLGDLVRYNPDEDKREEEIAQRTATLNQYHPALPGSAGQPLEAPSVFRSVAGRQFPTAQAGDLTEWGNTVAAVARAKIFSRVEFLNVTGLFSLTGEPAQVYAEHFVVRPATVYQLRVFQGVPVPGDEVLEPHDIEIQTFTDHIVQLRARQRAVGKYDMLNFVLKTKRLAPRERSAIEIPLVPNRNGQNYAPSSLYHHMRLLSPVLV